MKNKNSNLGFTLLELLIVVLIIAILTAIALPKYQLATDKARYAQAMHLLATINQAQNRYQLNYGTCTFSFYDLDIDMPASGRIKSSNGAPNGTFEDKWGSCWLHNTGYGACEIKLGKTAAAWYFLRWDGKYFSSNNRACWVFPKDNARAKRLCKALTGQEGADDGNYRKYHFY